ncbi:hypothetical protein [Streptomyces sp. WAC 06725]|uniref:hypothetical protein n=1 Tax=Streptomyces sp. WAC 06725 TaxID=2203209 RepID=UPI000F74AEB8|nr:hypothetical protein [Streptomyces sp. WAC 06725]
MRKAFPAHAGVGGEVTPGPIHGRAVGRTGHRGSRTPAAPRRPPARPSAIRARQRAGELDESIDPAALILITLGAGNALAVYPQLARSLFGTDASSPDLVERYAHEVARLFGRLTTAPEGTGEQDG